MEPAIHAAARDARAVLLANHGPVVSGRDTDRRGLCRRGTGRGGEAVSAAARQTPRLLTPAPGGRPAGDVRVSASLRCGWPTKRKGACKAPCCVRPGSTHGAGSADQSDFSSSSSEPLRHQVGCRSRGSGSLLAASPSCGQPSWQHAFLAPAFFAAGLLLPAAAFFFGAALRPAFLAAAFFASGGLLLRGRGLLLRRLLRPALRPAAFFGAPSSCRRHASPTPVRAAFVVVSSLLTCRNSFWCRWFLSRGLPNGRPGSRFRTSVRRNDRMLRADQLHRAGDPAWDLGLPRAPVPHVSGSATDQPSAMRRRRFRRFCNSASSVDARSALLHLDKAAVNGPSFCCRVSDDSARNSRIGFAHTLNRYSASSPAAVNKKQSFRRNSMKKMRARAIRCIDVTQSRRDSAIAAVFSDSVNRLSRACRSARTAHFQGRCSSQSGESTCCRCAAR